MAPARRVMATWFCKFGRNHSQILLLHFQWCRGGLGSKRRQVRCEMWPCQSGTRSNWRDNSDDNDDDDDDDDDCCCFSLYTLTTSSSSVVHISSYKKVCLSVRLSRCLAVCLCLSVCRCLSLCVCVCLTVIYELWPPNLGGSVRTNFVQCTWHSNSL